MLHPILTLHKPDKLAEYVDAHQMVNRPHNLCVTSFREQKRKYVTYLFLFFFKIK